jgi:hypothetical protein
LREAILACEGYDRDRDLVCAATDDFNGKPAANAPLTNAHNRRRRLGLRKKLRPVQQESANGQVGI